MTRDDHEDHRADNQLRRPPDLGRLDKRVGYLRQDDEQQHSGEDADAQRRHRHGTAAHECPEDVLRQRQQEPETVHELEERRDQGGLHSEAGTEDPVVRDPPGRATR